MCLHQQYQNMQKERDSTMAKQYALTTMDNPFNPLVDFNAWFMFDMEKGYNTSGYLARMCNFRDDMTQIEEMEETERAIDQIILTNPLNIYRKVSADTKIEINT